MGLFSKLFGETSTSKTAQISAHVVGRRILIVDPSITIQKVIELSLPGASIRRGRDRIRGSGTLGHAMQELEGLFVESKAHVIEADRAEAAEEKEVAGDE